MSAYREIRTEFRNLESFRKALADLGQPFDVAPDPAQPTLPLYGYHADERPEHASFVIRRREVNKAWSGGASNDLGFAWDGQQVRVIISDFDSGVQQERAALDHLRQRYAFHEINRQARARGLLVRETTTVDGRINIVFVGQQR